MVRNREGKVKVGCSLYRRVQVLGREIRIHVYDTGAGLNILIEGGDKGHIGAVAAAEPGAEIRSIVFPGHKEDVVCRAWAERLCEKYGGPVVVEAGIHYEKITKSEIQEILSALEKELGELEQPILRKGRERLK